MKPCLNEATTMTSTFEEDVKAYGAAGFRGIELWLEKLDKYLKSHSLEEAKALLDDRGLDVASACAQGDLMLTSGAKRKEVLKEFERKLKICQTLGCPVIITVTDFPSEVKAEDYEKGVGNIREAASIAERYGVSLALELIKGAKFLGSLSTAVEMAEEVNRKNVGVVLDTFHFWAGISKESDLNLLTRKNLLLVHLNDIPKHPPREILQDSDRVLPGQGIMPLKDILARIEKIGYDGYISLELFNRKLWEQSAEMTAKQCWEAIWRFM
ncbi:MAG: sugar phosphate isomerase/epimerase family protein [bacterium]